MTKKNRSIVISITVSIILIAFLFYGLQWDSLAYHLGQVRFWPTVAILVLFWISLEIRALRWRYLLPSHLNHPREHLFNCVSIGFFASAVLPLRAGEIIRPWLYSKRRRDLSFTATFASVVIERVFDTVIILALFAFVLGARDDLPEILLVGAYSLAVLAAAIVAVIIIAYFKPLLVLNTFKFFTSYLPGETLQRLAKGVEAILEELLLGLRAISNSREFFLSIFWTVILWLEISLIYQVGMYTMGQSGGFDLGVVLCVVIALAVAAPSAPGFVGTFQVGCVIALSTIYGYDREFALSYSIVIHALQYVSTIAVGIYALHREGLTFSEMIHSKALEKGGTQVE